MTPSIPAPAQGSQAVDLELALLVDVSASESDGLWLAAKLESMPD